MSARTLDSTILIQPATGDFAEDKDAAADLRETQVRPALAAGKRVVVDFTGVRVATQSFVHALVSDVLRTQGESVLDRVTFKGCTKAVKGIVETVVQYSLESIESAQDSTDAPEAKSRPPKRRK
jgi:hypothetical protein